MATKMRSSQSSVASKDGALARYNAKRDFTKTAEPSGSLTATQRAKGPWSFVVQKHAASRLHYDFRLELGGVLVSWAVPKGPSLDPADKRLAIHVEDHPVSYGSFEGTIPEKQYGAGTVIVWDHGTWEPVGDPGEGLKKGKLVFHLHGQKLHGLWELVRTVKAGEKQESWLLFKKKDEYVRPRKEFDVVSALPDSVILRPILSPGRTAGHAPKKPSRKTSKDLPVAVKAALPAKLSPQLATLATGSLPDGEWFFEVKYDGYRVLARFDKGEVHLFTRGGHDWTERMPQLAKELQKLGVKSGWLDGEIVVMGPDGTPDFNALQKAFDSGAGTDIVYFLFDAPFLDGMDLRNMELHQRRSLLRGLLAKRHSQSVRFSAEVEAAPGAVLEAACRLRLEGVIAKRADAPYSAGRTETWLKLKCRQRQEFVIAGYTDRANGPGQVGSLLLGVQGDGGQLVSVGSVGTGWDSAKATELKQQLQALATEQPPFAEGVPRPGRWNRRKAGSEHWVHPKLVAEVEFAQWTPDGQIRHASFVSLRSDKPAKQVVRERAKVYAPPSAAGIATTKVKVSHGDRVIDPSTGITKLDLVRYYESVAEWMLPHLKGRPVALVRGPTGVAGQLFFQKHDETLAIPDLKQFPPELWPGHPALLEVPSAKALASCAQMNVIEFHTWNSTSRSIDKPNRMVFDLDPGEGTPWKRVQEAAVLVRTLLHELGLESWLKTSGGKGLHVVVPLAPKLDYQVVKDVSRRIVQHLAQTIPQRFVAKSGPANRVGKLFVDYLRNGAGATTASAFSARARPGMGVSMPISWEALDSLKSGSHWTVGTAREYLSFQRTDPWAGYWRKRQTLTVAMQRLNLE